MNKLMYFYIYTKTLVLRYKNKEYSKSYFIQQNGIEYFRNALHKSKDAPPWCFFF